MNASTQQHHKTRPGCSSLGEKLLAAGIKNGKDLDAMGHEGMQAELDKLNAPAKQGTVVKLAQKATEKPAAGSAEPRLGRRAAPTPRKETKKREQKVLAFPTHEVPVPANREYVIIFECHKKQVLACGDIQIGASSGGGGGIGAAQVPAINRTQKQLVRVDMVTFDRHCTISNVNVLAIPGSSLCRVFVNFKSTEDDPGEHWGKGTCYEKFLDQLLFGRKWDAASIKDEGGKTTITLKKPDPDPRGVAKLLLAFKE